MNNYNQLSVEIVHEETSESLKLIFDNIKSINTTLAVLIGFNANFAIFFSRIPSHKYFAIPQLHIHQDGIHSTYYINQIMDLLVALFNWLLLIKPIIGILLIASIVSAIYGLSPAPNNTIISPKIMLQKSIDTDQISLLVAIINKRAEVLDEMGKVINKKASQLRLSLKSLGIAAVMLVLAIVINS